MLNNINYEVIFMGFLDTIRNLFNNNKKNAQILMTDFSKDFGSPDPFQCIVIDEQGLPLPNVDIELEINGVKYTKKTNNEGAASLNINLPCGKYDIHGKLDNNEYKQAKSYANVFVNPTISTQNMKMTEKDGSQFIAIVTSSKGVRLEGIPINFEINGVTYTKTTGINGEAKLNINLAQGTYKIKTKYNSIVKENEIIIEERPKLTTRMEGTNINKAKSDPTQYQCAVYDANGRVSGTVEMIINGVSYIKQADAQGLYKLPINLEPGSYKLTAKYKGDSDHLASQIVNTIVIEKDPVKITYNPISWLRQPNSYTCGPTSLAMCSQILGKPVSISAFSNACYTTGNGTSPANLIAGAKKLGFKVTQISRNISGVSNAIESGKPVIAHIMTGGVYCGGWQGNYGHYIVIYEWNDDYYYIADPTKGLYRCPHSVIDNAMRDYPGIKYYSVEKI